MSRLTYVSEAESTYPATATDHGPEDRKVGRPLVVFLVRLSQDCVELSREEAEWSGGECEVVGCPRHQRHTNKSRVAARTADRGRKGGRTKLRGNFKSCEQDPDLIDFSAFRDGSISLVGSGDQARSQGGLLMSARSSALPHPSGSHGDGEADLKDFCRRSQPLVFLLVL